MTITRIIGSGLVGGNLTRAAIAYGYDVVISNARGPQTLAGLLAELGPKAWAVTAVAVAASVTSRSWRFPPLASWRVSSHAALAATAVMIGERITDFIKTNAGPIMNQPIEEHAK
jgi:hypothetical protein